MTTRRRHTLRFQLAALALLLSATISASPARGDAADAIRRGDAAWQRRGEGARGGRAAKAPIAAAVAAYEESWKAQPGNLEAGWKLLRALWFQGEYATANNGERQQAFARGKEVSEQAWAQVGKRVGAARLQSESATERAAALRSVPEAPALLLFSAASWGLWGDAYGKLAAARQGVAGKVRDWAETLIALDARYEEGAGHRVLGRLHAEAPRVPFVTGWVDHDRAIAELEKALVLGPGEPGNKLYLAEAILEHKPQARARALQLLRDTTAMRPRPDRQVEDTDTGADAAQVLAQATKK